MADLDGELTVAERLGRALDRGLLPAGGPAEAAERLIERLERPARVALLGLPGSGKSSILNLLVGAVVVPETLRLPTIIVQHGAEARMVCTLTDGTARILPGADLAAVLPLAPALVTLELNLPALKVISLLEVSAGPMEAEQRRAATWASKRADIVIWCTTSYLPKEQAIWESLSDAVKDNSFMFLTKVDLLGSRESASAMHDRVELRAGEDFRQILSISAKQARAAMSTGGQVNRDQFRDSGAMAVIAAIKTRVQSGRRADMDTAELLLARHVEAAELVARRFAETGTEPDAPETWAPPPEPEAVVAAAEEPAAEPAAAPEADATPAPGAVEYPEARSQDDEKVQSLVQSLVEPPVEPLVEPPVETPVEPPVESGSENLPDVAADRPEPEVPAPSDAALPSARGRFADRIKRVAISADGPAAPLVPLRSTWKSKAELEAPPPEPEVPKEPERVRRPRPATAEPLIGGNSSDGPAETAETAANEIPPGSPQPHVESEGARPPRPQLFGMRRPAAGMEGRAEPLPDLSALRASPGPDDPGEDAFPEDAAEVDEDAAPAPVVAEPDEDLPPVTPEPGSFRSPSGREVPSDVRDTPIPPERPRLFDRTARARPAEPGPQGSRPENPVLERLPAPPRLPRQPAVEAEPVAVARSAAEAEQFTPRAIMARERPSLPEANAPRRERPRIAARAVAAATGAVAPLAVSPVETALLDQAISLIFARSAELQGEIDPESRVPVDLVLEHARETTERVMQITAGGTSEDLKRINGDLGEVLDLILLMQLEKGHAPADDALTLILQLRRELETLRAA